MSINTSDADPRIKEYTALLAKHDWSYQYSDDHSMWRKGQAQRVELIALRKELDPTGEIWAAYEPKTA